MADLVLRDGLVLTPSGLQPVDIVIENGLIVAMPPHGTEIAARQTIDARGQHILPGAIDIHFHIRAPSFPQRGTVASETRAAAAGGVTTLFEMPIAKPCAATPAIVRDRRMHFAEQAYVNFALFGAPGLMNQDYIDGMVEEGVIAFKIFTTEAPPNREDEFGGLAVPDLGDQAEALRLVQPTGRVLVVHAEDNASINRLTAQLQAAGRRDMRAHNESRPPQVEAQAIDDILRLNQDIGAKVHIAHVTSREALDVLRRYRATPMDVTGETCPHYLYFTEEDVVRHGGFAKINPPLRSAEDRAALWAALGDDTLGFVTTDHAPFSLPEKENTKDNVWAAPPGHPGVEALLLGMLDAADRGVMTLDKAVDLVSGAGARRFGLWPQKGALQPGSDADIAMVDLTARTTIDRERLFTAAAPTDRLFHGMSFAGQIKATIVGGKMIFRDGAITGAPGDGRFVRPLKEKAAPRA